MAAPTTENRAKPEIKKGLAGVVVDTTAISKVVPETNSLTYRGYPVQELAAHRSFEQVAFLLWRGELPTDAELALFSQRERANRARPPSSARSIYPRATFRSWRAEPNSSSGWERVIPRGCPRVSLLRPGTHP